MRYCVSCGLSVEEKWSFCPNCGSSKVPEKESNPVSNNVTESNGSNNQNQDETIFGLIAIIGIAFILFAIDRGADWIDLADAADDCGDSQDELEDLGIDGFSDLCRAAEREATELLFETFISAIIGLVLVLGSTGQMGETDRGQMGETDRALKIFAQNTKPRHKLQKSDRELKNRLQRNTRSNPIRCRYFFKGETTAPALHWQLAGSKVRCSNYHLNKMYCDEHIGEIESRME